MTRKRIPKGRVRRTVILDHAALSFALAAIRDDRYKVSQTADAGTDWEARYDAAEKHLVELIRCAEEA
jgi:hypothetical protein